jgi:NTE family protein
MSRPRIGLALSGGGARGLAHVPVIEALDEIGLRPSVIVGTSIGAIMGAGYAAGMSGADLRDYSRALFRNRTDVLGRLWQLRPKRVRDIFAQGALGVGQFEAERFLDNFLPGNLPRSFAELSTPLKVVATDFYGWHEVVLKSGPLFPALAASAALPILFRPVRLNGRVMVDGGVTNPLPFDLIEEDVDIVIAVDVVGGPIDRHGRMPGSTEAIFGATQLLMQSIMAEKMRRPRPPDILVRPPVDARVLDFMKAGRIMETAEPVKDEVKRLVERALAALAPRG